MSALPNQTNINSDTYFFLTVNASTLNVDSITAKTINTSNINALLGNFSSLTTGNLSSISTTTQYLLGSVIDVDDLDAVNISTQIISADTFFGNEVSTVFNYTDVGTISTLFTQHIILDQATLDVVGGNVLLLNGVPVATTQDLSTIQDWSIYPAYSTVRFISGANNIGANLTSTTALEASSVSAVGGNFSTLVVNDLSTFTINGVPASAVSASNWWLYPAKGNVTFQPDLVNQPQYNLSGVSNIVCNNLTAQLAGFPTPIAGGTVNGAVINGAIGNFGPLNATGGTFSNNTQTTLVEVYGVNRAPGFNALYVNGGFTVDAGLATHGITLGTNTAGVSLNRIDILPIGTQDYVTWGAMAHIAGLGMTLDAGLGINLAAGLIVDVLGQDVQLRANDGITLDADDSINLTTGGSLTVQANSVQETAKNFTFSDSNFTINSSNENLFNASQITSGTVLPPSTLGFYSTFQQNSLIENSPFGTILTAQSLYGLYQNISTLNLVVTSNISTIYTPSTIGLLSSFTSTVTSSIVRGYSTLAIVQSFPVGEVSIKPSSLLLQHADKIELDTKPFPFFTLLTPGLSTIVSSLYTYEAILDGSKYSEVGEVVQTIVPVIETLSSFNLSTGLSNGTLVSTLTSSFFSTLVSQVSFTSSIFNTMYFDSNCFSTSALCVSSLNGFAPLPAPYGSFTSMSSFTLGVAAELNIGLDTTEFALGTYFNPANTTEVKVDTAGLYRVIASVQFDTTSNQIEIVNLYFKKNGNLIPRTNSKVSVAKDAENILTVEIFIDLTPSDTLEVFFTSTDTNMSATAFPAGGVEPETPSIILNIQKIGV